MSKIAPGKEYGFKIIEDASHAIGSKYLDQPIGSRQYSDIAVHTQPYYESMGLKKGNHPNAESYYESAISIPMFQGLTIEIQDEVASVLKKVLV
jgi:dTDP-4-amino-4,6-dideoxygalactose transaminase